MNENEPLYNGTGTFDLATLNADSYTGDPGRDEFVVVLDYDQMSWALKSADDGLRVRVVIYALDGDNVIKE